MQATHPMLSERLGAAADWLVEAGRQVQADRRQLAVLFPQLPRRLQRNRLGGGVQQIGDARVDLDGWRTCDAGAALLLASVRATDAELKDLYAHGDLEERAMLLRALALLPLGQATVDLLGEVQRTNMVLHVEAAVCDNDLLVRCQGRPGFGATEQNRMMLKLAFLDLPLRRVFAGERLANGDLSRMLQDLATEREAAGRPVWRDTDRMLGRAPVDGTVARVLGGLEHGDDGRRLAAAEALLHLNRPELRVFAKERLAREPRAEVRALLQKVVG